MWRRIRSRARRLINVIRARAAYKFIIRDWTRLTDLDAAADVLATMRFSRNLVPQQVAAPAGKRVLVLAPHPDDEMIGPGGTVILALDAGCAVRVLNLTSGGADAARREGEAPRVAERVGFAAEFVGQAEGKIDVGDAAAIQSGSGARDACCSDRGNR